MSKLARVAGCVLCLGFQIQIASAAEQGFYFGVSGGQSEYKLDIDDFAPRPVSAFGAATVPAIPAPVAAVPVIVVGTLNPVVTPVFFTPFQTTTLDRTDASWSLTAGYRLNRYVSVELSYFDLGEAEVSNVATFTSPTSSFDLRLDQSVEISGLSAAVLGTWPVAERWSLHARGGYEFTDAESRVTFNGSNVLEMKDSPDNFVIGLGVDFAWTSHWSLRAEAERHLDVGGEVFVEDSDADVYRLAVLYRL